MAWAAICKCIHKYVCTLSPTSLCSSGGITPNPIVRKDAELGTNSLAQNNIAYGWIIERCRYSFRVLGMYSISVWGKRKS